MPQTFVIDQAASFTAVAFLSAEAKLAFGTDVQEKTKEGALKWELQLVMGFRNSFGKIDNEVVKVGYAGDRNPAADIGMYTPVALKNFTVGVMDKQVKDKETGQMKTVGAQIWYRVDDIRPTSMPAPAAPEPKTK